jgi:hypothetical protein
MKNMPPIHNSALADQISDWNFATFNYIDLLACFRVRIEELVEKGKINFFKFVNLVTEESVPALTAQE